MTPGAIDSSSLNMSNSQYMVKNFELKSQIESSSAHRPIRNEVQDPEILDNSRNKAIKSGKELML
jgi:hypothetical protein